jgi:hypothetical protein
MKTPFQHGKWHAWQGTAHILLSDEDTKELRYFKTANDCINWLYLHTDEKGRDAARALGHHMKTN